MPGFCHSRTALPVLHRRPPALYCKHDPPQIQRTKVPVTEFREPFGLGQRRISPDPGPRWTLRGHLAGHGSPLSCCRHPSSLNHVHSPEYVHRLQVGSPWHGTGAETSRVSLYPVSVGLQSFPILQGQPCFVLKTDLLPCAVARPVGYMSVFGYEQPKISDVSSEESPGAGEYSDCPSERCRYVQYRLDLQSSGFRMTCCQLQTSSWASQWDLIS